MTVSTDLTLVANTCASRLSACTFAAAVATPAMRTAMGATQGSSFANAKSAEPTAEDAPPIPPLASELTVPATSAVVPAAIVTTAAVSTPPPMPSAFSSLDSFPCLPFAFVSIFSSGGTSESDLAFLEAPQPMVHFTRVEGVRGSDGSGR